LQDAGSEAVADISDSLAPRIASNLGEYAVFNLKDLAIRGADEQSVCIVTNPFVPRRRHFQCEEPIVSQHIFGGPVRTREYLTVGPTVHCPSWRAMIGSDPKAPSSLEVVTVCIPVHRGRTSIPTMWLRNALVSMRTRMGLSGSMLCGSLTVVGWLGCSKPTDECDSTGQGKGEC
jgi:hypothetical protein